jgi:hypothetical protein
MRGAAGAPRLPFSDAAGPNATRLIWAFAAKQFQGGRDGLTPCPAFSYDPSRTALYSPERRKTLFEPGGSYTPTQWAVEAARLAYYRAETSEAERRRLTEALRHAGFSAPTLIAHAETHGFAFAALHADGSALVAFRGTQPDEIRDHATNLQAHQVDWPEAGGRVHAGFARFGARPVARGARVGGRRGRRPQRLDPRRPQPWRRARDADRDPAAADPAGHAGLAARGQYRVRRVPSPGSRSCAWSTAAIS